jgi:hypothetical protein
LIETAGTAASGAPIKTESMAAPFAGTVMGLGRHDLCRLSHHCTAAMYAGRNAPAPLALSLFILARRSTGLAAIRGKQALLRIIEAAEQRFLRVGQLLQRHACGAQILGALA